MCKNSEVCCLTAEEAVIVLICQLDNSCSSLTIQLINTRTLKCDVFPCVDLISDERIFYRCCLNIF